MDPARLGPPTALDRALSATPELRLLLAAARPAPPDLGAAVAGAVADGLDAGAFVRLARSHRVVPHVARALGGVDLPDAVRRRLDRAAAANARRQLAMAAALGDVLGAFAAAGVPSLPLKGPTLARWLFGDVAGRSGVDLDVLVPEAALAEAIAVLVERGYGGGGVRELTAAQAGLVAAEFELKDATFEHPGRKVSVELHWRPLRDRRLRAVRAVVEGGLTTAHPDPLRPSIGDPAAAAAFVLVHGAFHGYRRLTWLTDAAALAARLSDGEWAQALAIAREDGIEGALLLGPALAERWLGVPVPEPLRARVDARRRALRALAAWCQTDDPDDGGRIRPTSLARRVGLYDTASGRARRAWHYLARPSEGELATVDLDGGRWARRLARPRRLAANAGRWARRKALG